MGYRYANGYVIRDSQGEQNNPTTSTLMADTGQIDLPQGGGGTYEVLVVASADATAEFVVQQRDTANSGNVGDTHVFYAAANAPVAVPLRFQIERLQRVRVMMNANLTGNAVVNIFAQRVD